MNKNQIAKFEPYMKRFMTIVSEQKIFEPEELQKAWEGVIKKKTHRKHHPSAYLNFSKQTRPIIRQEDPSRSFGDIAKIMGQRWKQLSADEQSKYIIQDTNQDEIVVPETNQDEIVVPETNHDEIVPETVPINPNGYKISELRKLCEHNGLPTSTKRSVMIDTLHKHGVITV